MIEMHNGIEATAGYRKGLRSLRDIQDYVGMEFLKSSQPWNQPTASEGGNNRQLQDAAIFRLRN
jgi:hypothetical protein